MRFVFPRFVTHTLALILALHICPSSSDADQIPGIVSVRPNEGRYIETDQGFMVPYSQLIPGTDIALEMIPVPGGRFTMGSPPEEEGRQEDEGPQVEVNVEPYWIGKHEITWEAYRQYMQLSDIFARFGDLGVRQVDQSNELDAVTAPSKLYDPSFTFSVGEDPRQPAISMSQYAAKQFTKWLSLLTEQFYRLPTEVEWEFACRAGKQTAYSFGDDPASLSDYAWYYENSDDATHPVGEKLPNAWGIHDMHGNASEWVLDGYDENRYQQLQQGEADDSAILWPEELFPRILRGGSWNFDAVDCRSATRRASHDDDWRSYDPNSPQSPWWFASDESQDVGFRIVRPLKPVAEGERAQYWEADMPSIKRAVRIRIDNEGRGERGLVDPDLPRAIEKVAR